MTRRLLTLAALLFGPFVGIEREPADGLEITPASGTFDVPPYAQALVRTYMVKNIGDREVDVAVFHPGCEPFEMSCSWSTFSLDDIEPGESVPVTVTFTSGAPGWSGTINFEVLVNDNQTVTARTFVTVRVPQQAWVETKSLNPGTTIERSHCVAFPIGTNAAYECGDLRIAHALPSLRVRNDDRTPVSVTSLAMPLGYSERFRYTLDGLVSRDSVMSSIGTVFRAKAFTYNDARGKVTRIADGVGFRDTLGSRYSGSGMSTRLPTWRGGTLRPWSPGARSRGSSLTDWRTSSSHSRAPTSAIGE